MELLTLARRLGEPSAVVVGETGTAEKVAGALGEYGAQKVYVAEGDDFTGYLTAPVAEALAAAVAAGRLARRGPRPRPRGTARRSPPGWRSRSAPG